MLVQERLRHPRAPPKRKFEGRLMSKNGTAKVNEALAKVLCYNISVLIHESKLNKLKIRVSDPAHKLGGLHINSTEKR